jgi:hypothetical protein
VCGDFYGTDAGGRLKLADSGCMSNGSAAREQPFQADGNLKNGQFRKSYRQSGRKKSSTDSLVGKYSWETPQDLLLELKKKADLS